MAKMANENIVKVNVRKHKVIVKDELIVYIKHTKDCSKPCSETPEIIKYFEAELFVVKGFMVAEG